MSTHSPDQTTATATTDDHQPNKQADALGLGVSKLVAMMSNGHPNPADVAKLIALHPSEAVAMRHFLQQSVGNSFVQKVIKLEKPMMPANTGPSAKVVDGVPTGSKAKEGDDSAVDITTHEDKKAQYGAGYANGTANVNRKKEEVDTHNGDSKTVTNTQHLNIGSNAAGPGQAGANVGGAHAVATKEGEVERKTTTSGDVNLTADSTQIKFGRENEKVKNEDKIHGTSTDVGVKVDNATGLPEVEFGRANKSGDKTGTTTTGATGGFSAEGASAGVNTMRQKTIGTNADGSPITTTKSTNATMHMGSESSGANVATSSVDKNGTAKSASAGAEFGKEGVSVHAGYSIMTKGGSGVSASATHGTTVHTTYPMWAGDHWEVQYMRTTTNAVNVGGSVGVGGVGVGLGVGESAQNFDSGVKVFKDLGEAFTFRSEAAEVLGPPVLPAPSAAGAMMIPIGETIGGGNSNAISVDGSVSFMGASMGTGGSKTETHELDIKRVDERHVEVTVIDGKQDETHHNAAGLTVNNTLSKTNNGSKAFTYRFDLLDPASRKAFEKFCKDLKPPAKPVRTEELGSTESKENVGVAGSNQSWTGRTSKQVVTDDKGTHEKDDGTRSTEVTHGIVGHVFGDKSSHASANLEANVENGKEKSYTATIDVGGESGDRNREALGQYFKIGDANGTAAKPSGNWTLTADVSVEAVHAVEDKLHDFNGKTPAEKRQILNDMVAKGGGVNLHDKKPLDWDVELAGDKNFPGAEGRKQLAHQLADFEARVKDPKKAAGVLTEVDKTMSELAHRYVAIHDPGKYTDLPAELRAKVLDQLSRQLAQFRFIREKAQTMSIKNGDAIKHSNDPKVGESNTEIIAVQEKIADLNSLCTEGTQAIVKAINFPIHGHRAQFDAAKAEASESVKASISIDQRQRALDGAIDQARDAYLKTADQPGVADKLLSLTKDKAALLETTLTHLTMGAGALIPYILPKALDGFQGFWAKVDGLPGSAANDT